DISQLQTDQFEQQVLLRRTNLLNDQFQYLQALDQFKLQLGIPTNVPLEQDDSDFRPLNEQFQRYEDLFNAYKAASEAPARVGPPEAVPRVRAELRRLFTPAAIVRGTRFQKQIEADWDAWHRLSDDDLRKRLAQFGAERRRLLDRKTEVEAKEQTLPPA